MHLTHWGRVMYICVSKLIIGSDNGLPPGHHQAIIWTNAGILLIGPLGTNFSEILFAIEIFSFKKMHVLLIFSDESYWYPAWWLTRSCWLYMVNTAADDLVTQGGILLIGPLGTNFSEILSEIHTFSFNKMHLKMSSAKRRPVCLSLNVLTILDVNHPNPKFGHHCVCRWCLASGDEKMTCILYNLFWAINGFNLLLITAIIQNALRDLVRYLYKYPYQRVYTDTQSQTLHILISMTQLMSLISMTTHVRHLHDNCSAYHLGKPVVWRGQSDYWNHVALSLDKMAAVSQTIFSGAFSWMKSLVFWFKFHWSLFLVAQLTITQYWFR